MTLSFSFSFSPSQRPVSYVATQMNDGREVEQHCHYAQRERDNQGAHTSALLALVFLVAVRTHNQCHLQTTSDYPPCCCVLNEQHREQQEQI
jgi:hypothetical protein